MPPIKTLAFFISTSLIAGFLTGCKSDPQQNPTDAPPFVLVSQVMEVNESSQTLIGRIESQTHSQLSFQLAGLVSERLINIGDQVQTGQTLFKLDATDLALKQRAAHANLAATESELKLAQTEAKRAQDLLNRNLLSQQDFDRAQNQVTSLQQRLVALQRELDLVNRQVSYATLTASSNGVIQAIHAEPGHVVQAGQPVVEVLSAAQDLLISVPSSRIDILPKQAIARLETGANYRVTLREITPAADSASQSWTVRYALPDNSSVKLGQIAKLVFESNSTQLRLPKSAVFDLGQGSGVWLYQDGQIRFNPVEVVKLSQDYAYVKSDLAAGSQVVSAGVHLLKNGQQVQLRQLQEPTL
ncbi:efflux RND transporter periplasmic adaptor subunit [Thiomicrospira microaerophila]|uniref:efflux RND transporter periplasmic adaptor subunit n=1 Tax=Thiomicrospira microaerophila TaxID=406020 RepID=UPI00200EE4EE|nr:efflux RND transporter periplasmic adaptor subunit [Thiomicrospira microaerophila]UQB41523.1 efflux RND transporter periplasmic adaptor subunit [Thiomicrospira microaerophila]